MIYEIIEEIENKISELNEKITNEYDFQQLYLLEAEIKGLEIALKIIKK